MKKFKKTFPFYLIFLHHRLALISMLTALASLLKTHASQRILQSSQGNPHSVHLGR